MVAEAGSSAEGNPQPEVGGPRYQVVALDDGGMRLRNVGMLVGLSTVLFGFLATMAFGVLGGVTVAIAGALGHAIARFVSLRRVCPIAPDGAE